MHITVVVPRGQFDWIRENLAAELHVAPQMSTYYYGFNLDRPKFQDPRVRPADDGSSLTWLAFPGIALMVAAAGILLLRNRRRRDGHAHQPQAA